MSEVITGSTQSNSGTANAATSSNTDPNSGQSDLPDKFKGPDGVQKMAHAYEEAERELRRTQEEKANISKTASLLEQQLMSVQRPVHETPLVSEEQFFRQEWENDPALAVFNQAKRTEARAVYAAQDSATNTFYTQAKRDKENFPDFDTLEPEMAHITQKHAHLMHPSKIKSPETIELLYNLARASKLKDAIADARKDERNKVLDEVKNNVVNKNNAFAEGSSPRGPGTKSVEDMSIKEMEDLLGFVEH